MANDPLTYLNYYHIALWLSGRVDSTLVRLQKRTPEPVSAPTLPIYTPEDMQMPEEEQRLLWNEFFTQNKE